MYQNIFKDITIYRLFMTTTINQQVSTFQIYETYDQDLITTVMNDYKKVKYLKNATFEIRSEDVFHNTIEDGYYTFSHIYETGHTLNFSLYTMLHDSNIAEIISQWFEIVLNVQYQVTHTSIDHIAYANSSDGTKDFSLTFDKNNLPLYYGIYTNQLIHDSINPKMYQWQKIQNDVPMKQISTFQFTATITSELQQVLGVPQTINKRDRRNDFWRYSENKDYPFIGGYES